jgi:hypothetical protein
LDVKRSTISATGDDATNDALYTNRKATLTDVTIIAEGNNTCRGVYLIGEETILDRCRITSDKDAPYRTGGSAVLFSSRMTGTMPAISDVTCYECRHGTTYDTLGSTCQ